MIDIIGDVLPKIFMSSDHDGYFLGYSRIILA